MGYKIQNYIAKENLAAFCRRNHIRKIAIYGSALRGELRSDSDIDFLVEFEQDHVPGLIGLAGMEIELTGMIGRKVDMRTPRDLSRYFRDEVIRISEVQYEA